MRMTSSARRTLLACWLTSAVYTVHGSWWNSALTLVDGSEGEEEAGGGEEDVVLGGSGRQRLRGRRRKGEVW